MKFKHLSLVAAVMAVFFLAFTGCGKKPPKPAPAPKPGWPVLTLKQHRVTVEIADSDNSRALGLMYREGLAADHGMLFVYDREELLSFWMKNTKIPLSIAYIDSSGKIVDIQDMTPLSEESMESAKPARYALELNQGWFEKHAIQVGDTVQGLP